MALIELTSEERNGKAYAKTILLNTDTIAVPIREVGGKSYIGVNESIVSGRPSENLDIVYYLVTEDLATVVALSYDLFTATVVTRDGRTPSTGYNDLIFRLDRVVGNIATEGTGSKFMYHEDNGTTPVEFVVSQAPSAIISQTTPVVPLQSTYKALLTVTPLSSTSGLLVIGVEYYIAELQAGDDFTNVGYIEDGAFFTATGTTPTVWTNNTEVYNLNEPIEVIILSPAGILDDIVWTFSDPFTVLGTKSGAFTDEKTFTLCNNIVPGRDIVFTREDDDTVQFRFRTYTGLDSSVDFIQLPILIEVYP